MRPPPLFAFPMLLITRLTFALTLSWSSSLVAQSDPGISKALEGLPEEVRSQVKLTPTGRTRFNIDPVDPITTAIRFASLMQGDEDLKNRSLYRVGKRAMRQGRLVLARKVVAMITDFRAALLLAELAGQVGKSDAKLALEWWELATSMTKLVKPWQAESIASRLVVSGHLLGLGHPKVAPWFQAVRDPSLHFTTGAEIVAIDAASRGTYDLLAYRGEREGIKRDVPLPGLLEVAQRLFDAALTNANRPEASGLVRAALEVLRDSNVTHAELGIEAATKLFQAGEKELAKEVFSAVEKILGGPPDEVARLHYQMACLWQARGLGSALTHLLERGEKEAGALEQMYHPFAFSWLAAAWEKVGNKARSDALSMVAVDAARTNVNHRMRHLGAFEICLCHAATSRPLAANVAKLLHEIDGGN